MSATDFGDPGQIIHIPARDLTGTREAKLAELDMLLAQLQVVRLMLGGQPVRPEGIAGAAGQRLTDSSRLWSRTAHVLRVVRRAFAHETADTKRERS